MEKLRTWARPWGQWVRETTVTFILSVMQSHLKALREEINRLSRAGRVREGALKVKGLSRVL